MSRLTLIIHAVALALALAVAIDDPYRGYPLLFAAPRFSSGWPPGVPGPHRVLLGFKKR